ncbi:MAG: DoxX family protein [Sandaracinus sp.]
MTNLDHPLTRLDHLARARSHLGPTVLRLGLGTVFLAHAYAKLAVFTLPGTVAFFEANGLPGWTAYPVLAVELLGGLCLVAGYQVRLAALALIPVMLGALIPHAANGWMFTSPGGGWEYVAFLLVALVAQLLVGKGGAPASAESTLAPSARPPVPAG